MAKFTTSITLSPRGQEAVQLLKQNCVNVSAYIERFLIENIEKEIEQIEEIKKGEM